MSSEGLAKGGWIFSLETVRPMRQRGAQRRIADGIGSDEGQWNPSQGSGYSSQDNLKFYIRICVFLHIFRPQFTALVADHVVAPAAKCEGIIPSQKVGDRSSISIGYVDAVSHYKITFSTIPCLYSRSYTLLRT